jgi:hypothetical protein
VNVLFFMQLKGFMRHFEPTLHLMAQRGDRVHIAFDQDWPPGEPITARFLVENPGVTAGPSPARRDVNRWAILAEDLRAALNYTLYFEPEFVNSPGLRERMCSEAPRTIQRLAELGWLSGRHRRELLTRLLRAMERACPTRAEVERFVQAQQPDVVLVTPLVHSRSPQSEYVRVARRLGIRTGLCAASWDNFTTKGRIHELPDFVTVWNEDQKREAVEIHGVPSGRVLVTGAQTFDHWFGWRPSTGRAEFCRRVGLAADRPFALFVASSPFVAAASEPEFVKRWAAALRRKDTGLPGLQILVRPYPGSAEKWVGESRSGGPNRLVVWPRGEERVGDPASRPGFFDSIYHSAAVVGINTTAMIESAIVGRPVLSVLSPEFHHGQEGTLHFKLISDRAAGIVKVATTLEQHLSQLRTSLQAGVDERSRRIFLERFVRPAGLDRAAAPQLLTALDDGASGPPVGAPAALSVPTALRPILSPIASQAQRRRIRAWREADRP